MTETQTDHEPLKLLYRCGGHITGTCHHLEIQIFKYRGSPLSTIFETWKKSYNVEFVLVGTT